MKLFLNKPSPYARLALVVAHEKGLAGRLELEWVDPWKTPAPLAAVNPFSRVPALVTDDGAHLVDSGCICDYLDHLGGGRPLLPDDLPGRVDVLRRYGLARTLMDASFGAVIQRRFRADEGEPELAARWVAAAKTALDAMEASFERSSSEPDLGDLGLAAALGYIDFRLKELAWPAGRPRLAEWYAHIQARPSMQATPHE